MFVLHVLISLDCALICVLGAAAEDKLFVASLSKQATAKEIEEVSLNSLRGVISLL